MIKKQQKWIALFVALTFIWLLQVSTMPLAAANSTEQINSASEEPAPNFIEQQGSSGYSARKKSILPIILIGVGVVAVAAVLFLVVLKTSYDIAGEWTMNYTIPSFSPSIYPITFTGDKKTGTAAMHYLSGTYAVDGKKVTISMYQGTGKWKFIGEFKTKDRLEGDFKY